MRYLLLEPCRCVHFHYFAFVDESDSPAKLIKFNVGGDTGDFELLVDTFYKDFSGKRFPLSIAGEYVIQEKRIQKASASIGLGSAGTLAATGTAQFASSSDIAFDINTKGIDLHAVFDDLGEEKFDHVTGELLSIIGRFSDFVYNRFFTNVFGHARYPLCNLKTNLRIRGRLTLYG